MTKETKNKATVTAILACATIIAGTVLGLAGIDLVLPSVPDMPEIFGTTIATTQLVLAAFVAGSTGGLLLFGSLAAHFGRRRLFIASLLAYALFSYAASFSPDIWSLITIRFLQGAAGSGAAVLAPGLIRGLFSELGAMRAIGLMGSIEALVPGLAPIAGAWLHIQYGWQASFTLTAALVAFICIIVILRPKLIPSVGSKKNMVPGSYWKLLKNKTYLRYSLSHALVLGGLLTFVFTAPAVIIQTMDGTINHFIYMQMVGVGTFIVSANIAGSLVKRFGVEATIMLGTVTALLGGLLLLAYALFGRNDPNDLMYLFWLLNTGLGIRGGPGFIRALAAAHDDDDRAAALLILSVTSFAAIATAVVAPFIPYGLTALSLATCIILLPALILMITIKPLAETPEQTTKETGE